MNHGQFYKADQLVAGVQRPGRDLRHVSRRARVRAHLRRHVHRDPGGEGALARGPLPGDSGAGDRTALRHQR